MNNLRGLSVRNFPEPPTPGIFSEVTPVQMGTAVQIGGVLRRFPWLRSQQGTALQMRGVLWYKLEVYCQYFQTSCTGWGFLSSAHLNSTVRERSEVAEELPGKFGESLGSAGTFQKLGEA